MNITLIEIRIGTKILKCLALFFINWCVYIYIYILILIYIETVYAMKITNLFQ